MYERPGEDGISALLEKDLDDAALLELKRLASFSETDTARELVRQIDELRTKMQETAQGMSREVTSLDIVDIRELARDVRKTAERFASEQNRKITRNAGFGRRGLE